MNHHWYDQILNGAFKDQQRRSFQATSWNYAAVIIVDLVHFIIISIPGEKTGIGFCRILCLPRDSDDRSPIGSECRNPMWSRPFRWFPTAGNDRFRWSDSGYFRSPDPNGTDRIRSYLHRNLYVLKTRRIVIENNCEHIVILLYSPVSSIER